MSQQLLDQELTNIFGIDAATLERAAAIKGPLPQAYFAHLLNMLERSGAFTMLAEWDEEERKSSAGRKAEVTREGVLVAFFLNAFWGVGYSYQEIAATLAYRLSPEQRRMLGMTFTGVRAEKWYSLAWRATKRLRDLIDPWYRTGNLGKRLTGLQYAKAVSLYDPKREARAHKLAAVLVRASVDQLPKKYLADYRGDAALDSTFIEITGLVNPSDEEGETPRDRTNVDYQSGAYARNVENHDGSDTSKAQPGYEVTFPMLTDAANGSFAFPLITGIFMHRPGKLTDGAPRSAIEQHAKFTCMRGIILCDRAFNNLTPIYFQEHVRRLRFETGYDYRGNQLGRMGSVPGKPIVLVDGALYVDRMPEEYVMVSRWCFEGQEPGRKRKAKKGKATKIHLNPATGKPYTVAERDEIMKLREPYRLKPHGKIDADGYQRFSYPDPRGYQAFDPVTGKPVKDKPSGKVTIGLDAETIKHLQKYPWMSEQWNKTYGQRSQVESVNNLLKQPRYSRLDDRKARTGKGFVYTYLCVMMGIVAENLRRIVIGVTNVVTEKPKRIYKRRSRRRNSIGQPLERVPDSISAAASPPLEE